ncbi:hypothetical protein Scep_018489 [Stephania cephalantha]|uniref:Magnesium-transporting ATPase, P-type 1 n=1 Tax=Stephania cephalantha TaxID=152367 RepID=A0AAP0I979_9MAGN
MSSSKISAYFNRTPNRHQQFPPNSSVITESLVGKHGPQPNFTESFFNSICSCLQRLANRKKIGSGKQKEEEEKLYGWLYALAQSKKDLVYEYVYSTERGLSFREAERRLKENGPNEYSSSKAAKRLSKLLKCPVKVQRCAGRVIQTELIVQIDQKDIVAGDIIIFSPGDLFPGDVRLLTSKDLVVSQSSLTGESGTTEKIADIQEDPSTPLLELRNICFMGSSVVAGTGTGLVVSTGSKTYMSNIFLNNWKQKPPDAFQEGIKHVSYVLIGIMLVVIPIIILVDYLASRGWSESFLLGSSIAIVLTPQMLPLIVNTNLARGALAMARDKCIVKSVAAIQSMGAMDILCIDKTGTLTTDNVIVTHHLDSWGQPKERVLQFAFLNSYFKSELKNPVDNAILVYVYSNGYKFKSSMWRKIEEIPFDFTRRRVSVILETDMNSNKRDGHSDKTERLMVTKGALEEVLKVCSFVENVDTGASFPLSVGACQRIVQMGEELSHDGLRVIGVARKRLRMVDCRDDAAIEDDLGESNMVFLGVVTFFDPPKDSAKQALWRLAEKGVKTKVLTGDSLSLAIKVCKEVGIRTTHVITGPDLELLDNTTFHETVRKATVIARLTPTQKLRVVQSLQTNGNHVVGFLGDGINDSLALNAADVGISVDSGASVAKDLADIILLEKDLNVLATGVERGRFTYGNTMKYLKLAMVTNAGYVISHLIAILCLRFEPLTPFQILTQNFLYSVGQLAIPWDKMDEEYAKCPHRWNPKSLPLFVLWNAPVCSLCDIGAFIFIWFYYDASEYVNYFRSAWFVEGLLMQTLAIHLIRTVKVPFIQEVASWPVICSSVLVSAIGIAFPFTPVGRWTGLTPLPLSFFAFLTVLFTGYFALGQVVKTLYIKGSVGLRVTGQDSAGSRASVVGAVSSHIDVAVWGPLDLFVRLTGLGTSMESLEVTGKRLSNFAEGSTY